MNKVVSRVHKPRDYGCGAGSPIHHGPVAMGPSELAGAPTRERLWLRELTVEAQRGRGEHDDSHHWWC
jgi:hypothetical protein